MFFHAYKCKQWMCEILKLELLKKKSHSDNEQNQFFSQRTKVKMSVIIKWFKLDLVTSSVKQNNGK